jgi:hypothetical protein
MPDQPTLDPALHLRRATQPRPGEAAAPEAGAPENNDVAARYCDSISRISSRFAEPHRTVGTPIAPLTELFLHFGCQPGEDTADCVNQC